MTQYLIRRLLLIIPTLFGITLVTFFIIQMAPGDPVAAKLGMSGGGDAMQAVTKEVIEKMRAQYGLDQPLWKQYLLWAGNSATLNFGESYVDNRPVLDRIAERLPVTLQLSILSIFFAYLIAVPLGVGSAVKHNSVFDRFTTMGLFILYSLPNFWVALMLILFLGGGEFLNVFPIYGLNNPGVTAPWEVAAGEPWAWSGFGTWLADRAWHLVLPVFCLTYASLASLSRFARVGMLDVVRQDYIRTARAKGLSERAVIFRHAFRNSLIPIITLLGSVLPALLGGSVIIERIFSIPGIGQLAFDSILQRDYPTIMGIATITAVLTLIGYLISDILYVLVDPRIRFN